MTSQAGTSVTNCSFTSTNTVSLLSCASGRKVYRVRGSNFEVDECYSVLNVVGHGAYGTVVAATDERTGREVAIKKIGRVFDDLIDGRRIWREIVVLRLLMEKGCRGVMKMFSLLTPRAPIESYKEIYIVSELYENDLFQLIKKKQPLDLNLFRSISWQILQCIADMHAVGVIHRDMKPSNVLLTSNLDVSVCDFGLSRGGMDKFDEPLDLTDYVVTRWYRPPELLLMSNYHLPVDIWALGCVLGEYVIGRPMFMGRDYVHQLRLVLMVVPPCEDLDFISSTSALPFLKSLAGTYGGVTSLKSVLTGLPAEGVDFIDAMLRFNPNERVTARQALSHPFLHSMGGDWQKEYPQPPDNIDWSFDVGCEISEAQLRRKIWDEIEYWQNVPDDNEKRAN